MDKPVQKKRGGRAKPSTLEIRTHDIVTSQEAVKRSLIDESQPVDGGTTELTLKATAISDVEKSSVSAELDALEFTDIINHRKMWSKVLLVLVCFIIVSDFIIVFLVGLNALSYKNSFAIPAFIGSSILEIFALSVIVVKFLFPNEKTEERDKTNK